MTKAAKRLRNATLFVALSTLILGIPHASRARTLDAILASKEIRLGYVNFPPLIIVDPATHKVSGTVVEALDSVFSAMKLNPAWTETSWGTFAAALQSDQIDVFVGPSFATPQRSLALSFTEPYAFMGNDVVVRTEDAKTKFKDVKQLADLDKPGLTIAAILGSAPYDDLKAHFKHANIVGFASNNRALGSLELLSGRVDAAYWDAFVSARDVASHPGKLSSLFAADPLDISPISWAIKHHEPDLLTFLNTVLQYMNTNGTWQKFEVSYKKDLGGYFHAKHTYVPAGGLATQPQ